MKHLFTTITSALPLQIVDAGFIARALLTLGVVVSAFTVIHDVYSIRIGNEILNALYREEMRLMVVKGELLLERSDLITLSRVESQAILAHEMRHPESQHIEVWEDWEAGEK